MCTNTTTTQLPLPWLALAGALAALVPASAEAQELAGGPVASAAAEVDPAAGLSSEDPVARVAAVRQLGASGSPEAVAPLAQVLRSDPVEEVRGWAARSLAAIGTEEAMAAVAEAAGSDPSPQMRTLAATLVARPEGAAPAPVSVAVTASVAAPAPISAESAPVVVAPPVQPAQPAPRPSRRNLILTISGWSGFGLAYLASVLVGGVLVAGEAPYGWSWFVPVVGPAIYGSHLIGAGADAGGLGQVVGAFFGVLCWIPSLVQAAGVILGSIGAAGLARERREVAAAGGLQLAFTPFGPSDGPGLSVVGRF